MSSEVIHDPYHKLLDTITLSDGRTGTIVDEHPVAWLVEITDADGVAEDFVWVNKEWTSQAPTPS